MSPKNKNLLTSHDWNELKENPIPETFVNDPEGNTSMVLSSDILTRILLEEEVWCLYVK